jgi:hypothetical protein
MAEKIIYREELDLGIYFDLLIAGSIILTSYLSLKPYRTNDPPRILFILITLIIILVFVIFKKLEITIKGEEVQVGFNLINSKIKFSEMSKVELVKPPFWRYGGYGLRLGLDGSIGYITSYNKGLRITRIKGRDIFFSTNHPEELLSIINEKTDSA